MNEIELIPNCSESTFRIDISRLNEDEIKTIKSVWNAGIKKFMKENDDEYEPEGSEIYEKSIFGKKVLEAHGDFPFNCGDTIDEIVSDAEKKLKKKLRTEHDGSD
jgi:hypothetical protein